MQLPVQIRRRLSGAAGPPNAMKAGELAYNCVDDTLYFGKGDDGAGNAAGIMAIGGPGVFAKLVAATFLALNAPTAALGDNSTAVATTAFVQAAVQAAQQGLDVKASVRAATLANVTLSGLQTIDDVALAAGDRVLVKAQTSAKANGIYVASAGAWVRAIDADLSTKVTSGLFTFVEEGTANADAGWILATTGVIVLNTTSLSFTQFNSPGSVLPGTGLTKAGSTISIAGLAAVSPGAMLKFDGNNIVAAVAGTDYVAAGSTIDAGTY